MSSPLMESSLRAHTNSRTMIPRGPDEHPNDSAEMEGADEFADDGAEDKRADEFDNRLARKRPDRRATFQCLRRPWRAVNTFAVRSACPELSAPDRRAGIHT